MKGVYSSSTVLIDILSARYYIRSSTRLRNVREYCLMSINDGEDEQSFAIDIYGRQRRLDFSKKNEVGIKHIRHTFPFKISDLGCRLFGRNPFGRRGNLIDFFFHFVEQHIIVGASFTYKLILLWPIIFDYTFLWTAQRP